jgi:hypothetical protein
MAQISLTANCLQCKVQIDKRTTGDYVAAVLRDEAGTKIDATFHPTCFDEFKREKVKLDSPYYSHDILMHELVRPTH